MKSESLNLLKALINIQSITPFDQGAQDVLAKKLTDLGFQTKRFDKNNVSNLYAKIGHKSPVFLFAGHTDVVSEGNLSDWNTPPFQLTQKDKQIFGRGICDMKGGIVAMVDAVEKFIETDFNGSIAFLITSGEEGQEYLDGTPYAMEKLLADGETFDYCVVGEPSSTSTIGDVIKVGRRGSMTGYLTIKGIEGHVAYPHLANNPIHLSAPIIEKLVSLPLDSGNEFFPPSSLQITNINGGVGLGNVIPKNLHLEFNIRYNTEQSFEKLKVRLIDLVKAHHNDFDFDFTHNGPPFLTSKSPLIEAAKKVISEKFSIDTELSTSGGTSDGRFIAPLGIHLIELGLINKTIHKANEGCDIEDLKKLSTLYQGLLERLLAV